jgi:hypothetical protein
MPSRSLVCVTGVVAALTCWGCERTTNVRGSVTELSGEPLAGATVELQPAKGGIVARDAVLADGRFFLSRTHGQGCGDFRLRVTQPGYKTTPRARTGMSTLYVGP